MPDIITLTDTSSATADIAPAADTRLGAALQALLAASDADIGAASASLAPDTQAPAFAALTAVEDFVRGGGGAACWQFLAPLLDQ
eukprot:6826353-Prymnesium_polylepis.1